MGWDGNGFNRGGGSGSGSGATTTREEISYGFDMNGLENGIRGIQQGLCDGFYSMNTGLLNQTNGINNAICNLGYQTQQGFNDMGTAMLNNNNAQTIALMQNTNALQNQITQCCCDANSNFKDLQTSNSNNTRDIIDSQNAGTRAILEAIQQSKVDAMQDKIAALTAENTRLNFAASQQAQNNYLVNQLRPCPIPAYTTCNPWASQAPYGSCCAA